MVVTATWFDVNIGIFMFFQDRPERAIYNPAQRAAERRRAQKEGTKDDGRGGRDSAEKEVGEND